MSAIAGVFVDARDRFPAVGFTIAHRGITAGLNVFVVLPSAAVDVVRKGRRAVTHVAPLGRLVSEFMARGGAVWRCIA